MKVIGLLLVALTGMGIGWCQSQKLRRRADVLQSFERLAAALSADIRYTAAPVGELFAAAADQVELAPIRVFLHRFSASADPRVSFAGGLSTLAGQGLNDADRRLLTGFGEGLGTTDVAGQVEHCRRFEQQMAQRAADARQQAAQKGRLYTSLGAAGGLVVLLLWI